LRDTSPKLGLNVKHISRVESGEISLKVSTLLEFCDLVRISPQEFFYPNLENYKADMELLAAVKDLSLENKKTILDLAAKLR